MTLRAFVGADIFDGHALHKHNALLLDGDVFHGVVPIADIPETCSRHTLSGGTLLPGFVDLQVNGGGGVLFNDETHVDGLKTIAAAHNQTGTRAFLPTLITDTPDKTKAAIAAVALAIAEGVPGIVGIHLEGPHIAVARKGAHSAEMIRPMTDQDLETLKDAARKLPNVMVTVAPETVSPDQIARLTRNGVLISLGHTDCSSAQAGTAFGAGARCVTHLFNAMSQLGSREPGLVGAALDHGAVCAGLIADGIHVHPQTIKAALAAKTGPGSLFLVSDAMATVGSTLTEFHLNGRRVLRQDGRLTLEDGTLAGADLDLPTALSVMIDQVDVPASKAFAMATSVPAGVLRNHLGFGKFTAGEPWNGIYLDTSLRYDPETNAGF